MNSPADTIRQYLIDAALGVEGVTADWCVFVGFQPGTPSNVITVYDTAGKLDGRLMATGEQIEHPGIQVSVRGNTYTEAFSKADAIAKAFDAQKGNTIAVDSESVYTLHNVSRSGSIMFLGVEVEGDRRRRLFTINATISLEKIL